MEIQTTAGAFDWETGGKSLLNIFKQKIDGLGGMLMTARIIEREMVNPYHILPSEQKTAIKKNRQIWTRERLNFLIEHRNLKPSEIAARLGLGVNQVYGKIYDIKKQTTFGL